MLTCCHATGDMPWMNAMASRSPAATFTPRSRWIGTPQTRLSPEWRPFAAGLSLRSTAYALTVIGAMFRWLIEQCYVVANPFAGIKVRGSGRSTPMDEGRVFSEG